MKKQYDLHLPYYKQGDDLAHAMSQCDKEDNQFAAAFLMHAEQLEEAAQMLRRAASYAADELMEVADCGTHHISVIVDEELGKELCDENFLYRDPFYDEDEEICDLFEGSDSNWDDEI